MQSREKTRDANASAQQSQDVQEVVDSYEQRLVALAEENAMYRATKQEKVSSIQTTLDKKTLLLEHAKN